MVKKGSNRAATQLVQAIGISAMTDTNDTIQKIAGDMLALAELLHDPSPEKKRLRALAERLRALSPPSPGAAK